MLKALKKEPDMKWKDDITLMFPPRPRVCYKVDQSKDQALKKRRSIEITSPRRTK
jgi:hypothetical protein